MSMVDAHDAETLIRAARAHSNSAIATHCRVKAGLWRRGHLVACAVAELDLSAFSFFIGP